MKLQGIIVILFLMLGISQQAHSQQDIYKWRLNAGTGFMEYYGDLNRRFVSPVDPLINTDLSYLGYKFSVERFQSKAASIKLSYSQGQFIANDRAIDWKGKLLTDAPNFVRSLNAHTNISDLSIQAGYSFDNGHLLGKHAFISPYFLLGAGITFFDVYGDLFDKSGGRYFYWSDNTIRTLAETDPNSMSAEIIKQDGNFETNLTNLLTEQYYPNRILSIPFTAGIKIRTIDWLTLALELTTRYTFTDYLDDVSGDFRTGFDNALQQYASNPNNVTGNKRGSGGIHNDMYSMFSVSIQYSLGERKNVFNAIKIFPSKEKDAYLNQIVLPVWHDQYIAESDTIRHPVLLLAVNPDDTVVVRQNVNVDESNKITVKDSQVLQIDVEKAKSRSADTMYADTVKSVHPKVFPKMADDTLIAVPPYFIPRKEYTDSMFTMPLRDNPDKVIIVPELKDSLATDSVITDESKSDTISDVLKTTTSRGTIIVESQVKKKKRFPAHSDAKTKTTKVKTSFPDDSTKVVLAQTDSMIVLNKNTTAIQSATEVKKATKKTGFPLQPDTLLPKPATKPEPKIIKTTVQTFTPVAGTGDQQNIPTATRSQINSFNPVSGLDESQNALDTQPKRAANQQITNIYPAESKVTTTKVPVFLPVLASDSDQAIKVQNLPEYSLLNDRLNLEMEKSLFYKEEAEFYKKVIMHNLQFDSTVKVATRQDSVIRNTDSIAPAKVIVQDTLADVKIVVPIKTADSSGKKMEILINKISAMEKELAKLNMQLAENQQDLQLPSTKVFFASGSYQLSPTGKQMLQKIVIYLQAHNEFGVQLNGYADKIGNPQKNLALSKKRAQSVSNYLVSKNIIVSRIRVSFNGEDTGQNVNSLDYARRVEVDVVKF